MTSEEVALGAQEKDADSGIHSLQPRDGDAILFDGRIWHGSENPNRNRKRYALQLPLERDTKAGWKRPLKRILRKARWLFAGFHAKR